MIKIFAVGTKPKHRAFLKTIRVCDDVVEKLFNFTRRCDCDALCGKEIFFRDRPGWR